MRLDQLALLVLLAAVACGGSEPGGPATTTTPPSPVVSSIGVSPPSPSISARQTITLAAQARDSSGSPLSTSVSWTSSDTLVAVVSASGVVAGVSAGTATITATQAGKS